MKKVYEITLAGRPIRYSFQNSGTKRYLIRYLQRSEADSPDILAVGEELAVFRTFFPEKTGGDYVEYRLLSDLTARELLRWDCCIFHSVSFVWKGKAFLLSASSGTGKTTQYLNWQRLFPGEITMISGDMPVLERREDGSVWAHPSPWNGKEKIQNSISAPVCGIVLLSQGEENAISPLTPGDAVMPFFDQFVVRPETEEQIYALARLMDQILRNIPCYKLVNRGDDASTMLLRETLAPLAEGGDLNAL